MSEQQGDLPTAEIMRQIQENAPKINNLANQLTEQIQRFEGWFNELPGRVETYWRTHFTTDSAAEMVLRFHRVGKRWIISLDYDHPFAQNDEPNWKALTDASIEEKLIAIDSFPKLLRSMLEAQSHLKERLTEAHAKVDSLANDLEAARKGGA